MSAYIKHSLKRSLKFQNTLSDSYKFFKVKVSVKMINWHSKGIAQLCVLICIDIVQMLFIDQYKKEAPNWLEDRASHLSV